DRNRSHWSTSKTPSYTKSVSWQHHPRLLVVPAVALIHYLNEMCQSTETAVNDAFCRTLTRESLAIP
ncbi:hypothetical protein ML312_19340, partial [Escherichia coli]|nr:hypothetical protein [Escherichia coli]